MNLIEAKQYGIPVVLYELPYVELIKDQKGIIPVPQHSVKEAAEAIIELLCNDSKREALSLASEQSLDTFRRRVPSHIRSWKDIIDKLESKEFTPPSITATNPLILIGITFGKQFSFSNQRTNKINRK